MDVFLGRRRQWIEGVEIRVVDVTRWWVARHCFIATSPEVSYQNHNFSPAIRLPWQAATQNGEVFELEGQRYGNLAVYADS